MKILFVGTLVPEEIEYKEPNVSSAGNRFQSNVVANLQKLGHEVEALSYVGMPISEDSKRTLQNQNTDATTYYIKHTGMKQTLMEFHKLLSDRLSSCDLVMCYNVVHVWMRLPKLAEKLGKKSVLFLADYSPKESYAGLRNLPGRLYAAAMLSSIRRFNTVVGLSANVQGFLKEKQGFTLMEGGIDQKLLDFFEGEETKAFENGEADHNEFRILVSGLLSPVTGTDRLITAFTKLPSTICGKTPHLYLTGKGPLEELVRDVADRNERIHYLGSLPYEEYLGELAKADLLVNPRNMALPENQNNFPSKIMDYIASGKPILSTEFIGKERFAKVIFFCDHEEDSLAKGMEKAIELLLTESSEEKRGRIINQKTLAESFEWSKQLQRLF